LSKKSRTCGWNRGAGFTEIKAYGHEDPARN
jgi:hypothetical protein